MAGISRRALLSAGTAAMTCLGAGAVVAMADDTRQYPLLLSAVSQDHDSGAREHYLQAFSIEAGAVTPRYRLSLPGRAHHVAVSATQRLFAVIARRPGQWLVVGDLESGEVLQTLNLPTGRHLQGHAVFSPDGSEFWTVESAYEADGDNGRIGYWQVDRGATPVLSAKDVFDTRGTGAHELVLMPDSRTLAVANGGIRTHPDHGRSKLNLDSMDPSLVYLDGHNGHLLEQVKLPARWHQNSIRHLDVNAAGDVAFATQYQGAPFDDVPLVAFHRQGEALRMPSVDAEIQRRMKQYCGSVRFDESGRYLAVTCPRGNLLTIWDVAAEKLMDSCRIRDVCGVSASGRAFVYTTGTGLVGHYDPLAGNLDHPQDDAVFGGATMLWDNHLSRLEVI